METNIVLASASPRRRELLENIGLRDFEIIPSVGDEHIAPGASPSEAVCELSKMKALEVSKKCEPGKIIIAADTLVALGGEILGKPRDENEAAAMLRKLSGNSHTVYTGVTVMRGSESVTEFEASEVFFREMTELEISAYVASGEPMDKAGAYGAQGIGALFVEKICGDFFNVMGLPMCRLSKILKKLGVSLI